MAKGIQLKDKAGNKVYAAPYFPIGSIYLSVNKTNPSKYFGGEWVQLYGGYLYAAQSSIGKTDFSGWNTQSGGGGTSGAYSGTSGAYSGTSGSTAISIDQMPSHNHTMWYNTNSGGYASGSSLGTCKTASDTIQSNNGYNFHVWTHNNGGGKGHTHSIPSHTHSIPSHTHSTPNHTHNIATVDVFVWKRVA